MVLIALEGVNFELLKASLRSVEKLARLRNLFQKKWIGAIYESHVYFALGKERLEVLEQPPVSLQGGWHPLDQQGEIDVASRVKLPRYRGAKAQQDHDPMFLGNGSDLFGFRIHASSY